MIFDRVVMVIVKMETGRLCESKEVEEMGEER